MVIVKFGLKLQTIGFTCIFMLVLIAWKNSHPITFFLMPLTYGL